MKKKILMIKPLPNSNKKKILEFETFFPLSQKKNFQKNLLLFSSSLFSSEFLFRFSLQIISIQKTSHKKLPTTEKNLHKNYFFYSKSSHRWIEASFSNLPVRKDFEQYLIFGLIFSSFWPTSVFFLMSCIFAFYLR